MIVQWDVVPGGEVDRITAMDGEDLAAWLTNAYRTIRERFRAAAQAGMAIIVPIS